VTAPNSLGFSNDAAEKPSAFTTRSVRCADTPGDVRSRCVRVDCGAGFANQKLCEYERFLRGMNIPDPIAIGCRRVGNAKRRRHVRPRRLDEDLRPRCLHCRFQRRRGAFIVVLELARAVLAARARSVSELLWVRATLMASSPFAMMPLKNRWTASRSFREMPANSGALTFRSSGASGANNSLEAGVNSTLMARRSIASGLLVSNPLSASRPTSPVTLAAAT